MANVSNWKNLERVVASKFSEATGLRFLRNPGSGASNANDKGERRGGDVIVHSDFNGDFLIEAKVRASHAHHSLFRAAQLDAKKNKLNHAILFTKTKGETGHLVVMDSELFYKMLAIPAVQKLIQKDSSSASQEDVRTDVDGGNSSSLNNGRSAGKTKRSRKNPIN